MGGPCGVWFPDRPGGALSARGILRLQLSAIAAHPARYRDRGTWSHRVWLQQNPRTVLEGRRAESPGAKGDRLLVRASARYVWPQWIETRRALPLLGSQTAHQRTGSRRLHPG